MAKAAAPQQAPVREEKLWEEFGQGDLLESAQVDRAGNMLRNVKLLGKHSKNGREYSEQALNDAARLYHNAPFYLDHPTKKELQEREGVRSVNDLAGRVVTARRVGDAVFGDIQVLEREPVKSLVFALAEQMPKMAGNSHRVQAKVRAGERGDVVESVSRVFGVELVTDPATTAGLFESVQEDEAMDLSKLTLEEIKKHRPELVQTILAEAKGTDELATTKAENATLKAAAVARDRAALVLTKLAEAKLPEKLVTDAFKAQLAESKDAGAIDALIADRKALAKDLKPANPSKSTERKVKESGEGETTSLAIEEAKLGDHARSLGVRLSA